MKKIIASALLLTVLPLYACGAESKKNVTPPDGSLDKCTIRFSWWGGDDRHEATLKAIELWEKLHPDIHIVPEYGGWDGWTEKVSAQLNGGTEPDVIQINYDWLVSFSPDGTGFYDLDLLSDQLDLSGFDKDILSFGTMNGKLNAVTVSLSGRGLFYNSQVYDKLNASFPETWEQLISLGEKFNNYGIYPLDLDNQSGGTAWYLSVVYVQQLTGKEFITMDGKLGFSEADIKTAVDFYKSLEDAHVIRTIKTRTDEDGNAALYQSPEFINGNVAGCLEWGSSIGKYEMLLPEGVLKAGPLLTDNNGNSGGWMIKPSLLYAVSDTTEYPDEAAAFINFLLNDTDCAELLGTTRGIPASSYAENHLESKGLLTGLAQENDHLLEELDTVTISPYMEMTQMKEFYNSALEAVSYGTMDTETAAKELYNSINSYLERITK